MVRCLRDSVAGSCAGYRGAGNVTGEGACFFVAKRDDGSDGRALGMEAEMIAPFRKRKFRYMGLGANNYSPLPRCVLRNCANIAADSPTARRLCKGYRLWVIGY